MALVDIMPQLEEPFALEDIELLPKGSVEREGKTLCMGMPYADVRVYQDRLNKLAPGEWSTPPPLALVVGTKLVCYVTIILYGVPHTDVGEAGPGENQGTEAFAQAFKRAASQFGLGRYLYNLEKAWVPYDARRKQISLDANGIKAIVRQMYQKAGVAFSQNGNAPRQPPQPQELTLEQLKALCDELYGTGKWEKVRSRVLPPEEVGDITDDLLSQAQKTKIHAALIQRQKAVTKTAATGGK